MVNNYFSPIAEAHVSLSTIINSPGNGTSDTCSKSPSPAAWNFLYPHKSAGKGSQGKSNKGMLSGSRIGFG